MVNGAVNLAARRPIISLLPTFLHARHLFGLYESDSKPVTRGEQRASSCNRTDHEIISHVRLFCRKCLGYFMPDTSSCVRFIFFGVQIVGIGQSRRNLNTWLIGVV